MKIEEKEFNKFNIDEIEAIFNDLTLEDMKNIVNSIPDNMIFADDTSSMNYAFLKARDYKNKKKVLKKVDKYKI